jgi:hypothetical protein
MRSYLMYQTLNILFSVVENYAKKNRNRFPHCGFFDRFDL